MNVEVFGSCPKCGQVVDRVTAGHVTVEVPGGASWHGISHTCPACRTVLGVEIDPIALKRDLVDELFQKLRK